MAEPIIANDLSEPSDLRGSFEVAGHQFEAYMPKGNHERQEWRLLVKKGAEIIHRETIPMMYAPIYGVDAGDDAALNARVEEVIKELGLE